jgi:hypothetical protein
VLIKTRKDILCGGFSSIDWKSSGDYTVDKKCFIFSLKLRKVYKRLNDKDNLYFGQKHGPFFGDHQIGIYQDGRLYSFCNRDPFKVPSNA